MAEPFSSTQIETVARYLADIIQRVVTPLQLEYFAQAAVLNQMKRYGPDLAEKIETALKTARADISMVEVYRLALDKALQQVFGQSTVFGCDCFERVSDPMPRGNE